MFGKNGYEIPMSVRRLPNATKFKETEAKIMAPKILVTPNLNLILKNFVQSSLLNYFLKVFDFFLSSSYKYT